jgi:hypothetical protein
MSDYDLINRAKVLYDLEQYQNESQSGYIDIDELRKTLLSYPSMNHVGARPKTNFEAWKDGLTPYDFHPTDKITDKSLKVARPCSEKTVFWGWANEPYKGAPQP